MLVTHNLLVLGAILCLWWPCPGVPALVAPGCHPVPSVSLPAASLCLLWWHLVTPQCSGYLLPGWRLLPHCSPTAARPGATGCHWCGVTAPCRAPVPGSFGMWQAQPGWGEGHWYRAEVVTVLSLSHQHGSGCGSLHWGRSGMSHRGLCLSAPAGAAVPGPGAGTAPACSGSNFSSHASAGCGWDRLCWV